MHRKVFFLVHTEFHLLMVSSLIKQYFENTENHILITKSNHSKRFKLDLNLDIIPAHISKITIDDMSKQDIAEINEIIKLKPDDFIYFHEQNPIHWLLSSKWRYNTKKHLGPEGTFPYITFNKKALGSRVKETYSGVKWLFKNSYYILPKTIVSNNHGYYPTTDYVWITSPEKYFNRYNRIIRHIELLQKPEIIEFTSQVFNFNIKDHLQKTNNIILYINNIYVGKEIYEYEINFLDQMRKIFPTNPLYVKLHPNTSEEQRAKMMSIEGVRLNTSTIPAELFISNLQESIILSMWSASLMINNPNCNLYWCHPMLLKSGIMHDWWTIKNPFNHITEVENLYEIKFPKNTQNL